MLKSHMADGIYTSLNLPNIIFWNIYFAFQHLAKALGLQILAWLHWGHTGSLVWDYDIGLISSQFLLLSILPNAFYT
jgi:hypothetical protein